MGSVLVQVDDVEPFAGVTPEWAWGGSRGEGVRVAVIDSGVDADHPLLDGCVETQVAIEVDGAGVATVVHDVDGDDFGHGTACAGIVHSIAPEASIISVKVLGEGLSGKAAAFHRGLQWAAEQGCEILNLSLGTNRREWALPFYEACDEAYFRGSLVVAAANNVSRSSYPSLFASVVSVACNLATDPMRFHHNPQPPTEFLARGIDVEVAWRAGARLRVTGNSYAAPHLSGIAALVRAKHPWMRPHQVKAVLSATAANVREAMPAEPAGRIASALHAKATASVLGTSPASIIGPGSVLADYRPPPPER